MESNQATVSGAGRRSIRWGAVLCTFVVAAISNGAVHAGLTFTSTFTPLPNVLYPRDAAVGVEWPSRQRTIFTARGDSAGAIGSGGNLACQVVKITTPSIRAQEVVPGSGVYRSGVNGIGVKFMASFDGGPRELVSPTKTYATFDLTTSNSPNPNSKTFEITPVFVITALPVGSGQLSLPLIDVWAIPVGACPGTASGAFGLTQAPPAPVYANTCALNLHNQTVNMREVGASDFPSVGDTLDAATFGLDMYCDAGVVVGITFSNSDALGGTVLPTTGSARGLGIQIIPAITGAPVVFGADSAEAGNSGQFLVIPERITASGWRRVGFSARYIRTGTVLPGSVVARATYTLSYQ